MFVRLLDSTKIITVLGQRLSAEKPSIEVSKTALLNATRVDGRDKSSDVLDLEILFQKGLIQIEDDGQIVTTYQELQQIVDNGYMGAGGASPFDGVPQPVGAVGQPGLSALYARGDHVHAGAGAASVPVFVWDVATPWASIYAAVQAFEAAIVLVPNDGTMREMTPDPLGVTDINHVQFVGVQDVAGHCPVINIDSLGVGGFSFPMDSTWVSKDVQWRTYYRVGGGDVTLVLDGGGLSTTAGNDTMRCANPRVVLRNGANVKCHAGGLASIVSVINGTCLVQTGSSLGSKVFRGYAGPPPAILDVYADASATFASDYTTIITGINYVDLGGQVLYDDLEQAPPLGADTIQSAVDVLKTLLPVVVWNNWSAWDQVYEKVLASNASVILIPADGVNRIMTPPPGGAALTDLSNVLFVGLRSADGAGAGLNFGCPIVEIDPGGVAGGVSLAHHRLRSKDINWIAYYRITGIDDENPYIEFDGGSFHQAAGPALTRHNTVTLVLRNGAAVTTHAGAAGLLAMAAHVTIIATNGASLGARTVQMSVLPQQLDLTVDASVTEDPGAFIGVLSLQRTRWDVAGGVSYDDTLALPALGVSTAQEAIDALKAMAQSPLRLSTPDRLALTPDNGTLVYDIDERKLYIWQFDIDWPIWAEV